MCTKLLGSIVANVSLGKIIIEFAVAAPVLPGEEEEQEGPFPGHKAPHTHQVVATSIDDQACNRGKHVMCCRRN